MNLLIWQFDLFLFSRRLLCALLLFTHIHLLSRTTRANFSQSWYCNKASLCEVHSNKGLYPIQRKDNSLIAKMHWGLLKIFSWKPQGHFNQTWHKASFLKETEVCSNEWPSPVSRGDNSNIPVVKMYWQLLKMFKLRSLPFPRKDDH